MKNGYFILPLLLLYFKSFCQAPELPKFKSVKIESFSGAPARYRPNITSNIAFWIAPNSEIIAIDFLDGFIEVFYKKDTVYIFADNFKNNIEIQNQIDLFLKIQKDRENYFTKIKDIENRYKDSVKLSEDVKIIVQQEVEHNEYVKGLYLKYKSLNSPLAFAEASVTYNSIGNPEANVSVYNISENIIDAFEVSILCYDNYNRPVKHYLYKTNVFKGISQEVIEPSNGTSGVWTLYGHENTTKVIFILKSVHYKNKGAWYPKNRVSIKSE